jgi:hypothetical protein
MESRKTWPYVELDPHEVAALAYQRKQEKGCMYAVFAGIVELLAREIGEPYASFPLHMMTYGRGGFEGRRSICGALNGAGAIIALLVDDEQQQRTLIREVTDWHDHALLPEYIPEEGPLAEQAMLRTVAGSEMCRESLRMWQQETGEEETSELRFERCARLTADIAAFTAVVLNRELTR